MWAARAALFTWRELVRHMVFPNDGTQPGFGQAMARAAKAGVQVAYYGYHVETDSIKIQTIRHIRIPSQLDPLICYLSSSFLEFLQCTSFCNYPMRCQTSLYWTPENRLVLIHHILAGRDAVLSGL